MTNKKPVNTHNTYHAHIYFDETTVAYARQLCEVLSDRFNLRLGRFHEKLVGPHRSWSCQVVFAKKHFDSLIPWLDENKKELNILIHAVSGDDYRDHTDYAYWLGKEVELNLAIFNHVDESIRPI